MGKPKIKIGVKVAGGFGTVLVRANFLHCLFEYVDDAELKIFACGHISPDINLAIFNRQPSIAWYGSEREWDKLRSQKEEYALLFELDIYPKVVYVSEKIQKSVKLSALVELWEKFRNDIRNQLYFQDLRRSKPYEYSKLIIQGKTILNSADIEDVIGVGREYRMPVSIIQNEEAVLERFGLCGKKYITLQRGINPKLGTTENNKLWPLAYFNELIQKIKTEFPEYTIVQLGESAEHCVKLDDVDVNLLGCTAWDDIKILLKNAYLHIDGECGMVHLRKALHAGPSLVFFGPTPIDLFGYDGNFNLHSDACKHWCAELRDDWEYHCLLDVEKAPCMYAITPDMAMSAIKGYLASGDTSGVSEFLLVKHVNDEIAQTLGYRLDEDYVANYLNDSEIWDYEIKNVPVAALKVSVYDGKDWDWLPLAECPAYLYLSGKPGAYAHNMKLRDNLEDNKHSVERYEKLIKDIEANDFDENKLVLISSSYRVKDGQHRASIWMHKYGKDSTIPVLMIYMRE